jgi:hypothetical protein
MERLVRWTPVAIALGTLLVAHGWYVMFMLKGAVPLESALFASLREIPNTALLLLPAWLPVMVPSRRTRLSRWVTVICGAISLAVALSFGVVAALRQEKFFVAVAAIYAAVGLLHLFRRLGAVQSFVASKCNGT